MPRLFVAFRPPIAIREQLLTTMHGVEGARWQDDEQLHLTLRFIGDVDPRTGDDIVSALTSVTAASFPITIAGVGRFDRRGRTDALWAGVAPHDGLARLHRKIDYAVARTGLPPEGRAYLPHITLARFAKSAVADVGQFLRDNATLVSAPFPVSHFALFESRLGGEGARYTLVERWRLG